MSSGGKHFFSEYNPTVRIICAFSNACFNMAVAIGAFTFTGLGAVGLGIEQQSLSLTTTQLAVFFVGGLVISGLFVVLGTVTLALLKLVSFKRINDEMNS